MGSYARRNWAPDYPIGRRAEQDGWLRPTPEQWGRYAARRFLEERAPSVAGDEEAIRWYASYLVRGASPAAVAQITDMNEEIDVRHVLPAVRVPALVLYREHEYMREASRYMGARLPGARVVELPGADHLPWEGARTTCWTRSSVPRRRRRARRAGGDPDDGARRRGRRRRAQRARPSRASAASRSPAPAGRVRASFDGPARAVRCASALAEVQPELRAGVHTGECERRGGALSGAGAGHRRRAWPRPPRRARSSPPRPCTTSSRGSGVEFEERGAVALPLAGASREWRLFAVVR